MEAQSETFLKTDMVENFDDLLAKIDDDIQRQKYLIQRTQQGVNLVPITKEFPLSILAHILVKNNLEKHIVEKQSPKRNWESERKVGS